jgi:hypothetical protein
MISEAAASYIREVREGAFPAAEHCYEMPEDELRALAVDDESGDRKGR